MAATRPSWSLEHEPQTVAQRFSLVELLELGGGAKGADLDAWGTSAIHTDGCTCTRLPSIRAWRLLDGRPQFPMMAATMGDFNLAMALMLREMNPSVAPGQADSAQSPCRISSTS
jgi:hypothetical protein